MRPEPCFDWVTCPDCGGLGEDEQAHFSCSACQRTGTVPARRYCYQVTSPEMATYSFYEPPEPFVCFGIYVAHTKREALVAAVKDSEFKEWVVEARGDRVPPYKGLKVELARCDHGVCWACTGDEDGPSCLQCRAELADHLRRERSRALIQPPVKIGVRTYVEETA